MLSSQWGAKIALNDQTFCPEGTPVRERFGGLGGNRNQVFHKNLEQKVPLHTPVQGHKVIKLLAV